MFPLRAKVQPCLPRSRLILCRDFHRNSSGLIGWPLRVPSKSCRSSTHFPISRVFQLVQHVPRQYSSGVCVSLEEDINTWSGVEDAIRHASDHGHLYSDVEMVLGIQRLVSLLEDDQINKWTISQGINDFIRVLGSRMQRQLSPAAVALVAEILSRNQLQTRMLLRTCHGGDRTAYRYLLSVAEHCKKRGHPSRELWGNLVHLLATTSMPHSLSDVASFLAMLPALGERDQDAISRLSQYLREAPLVELKPKELVQYLAFLAKYGSSDHEVVRSLTSRDKDLDADDIELLCGSLESSRNADLAMVLKSCLFRESLDLSSSVYVRSFTMVLVHDIVDTKFVAHCLEYLTKQTDELDHSTFLSLFQAVSLIRREMVPEAEDFVSEVLLPLFKSHVDNMPWRKLKNVIVFLKEGVEMPPKLFKEFLAVISERLATFSAEDVPIHDIWNILPQLGRWPFEFRSVVCSNLAKMDWPVSSYGALLESLMPVIPKDTRVLGSLALKMIEHLPQLSAPDLIRLHSCLEHVSSLRKSPVGHLPLIKEELLRRIGDEKFPLGRYADVVRIIVSQAGETKQEDLDAVAAVLESRRQGFSGDEWVKLLEAWSANGDCNKDLFLTACTSCRNDRNWKPAAVVRMLSAVAKGGIVSRHLMMDFQNQEWAQKLVGNIPNHRLVQFLECFAVMGINAHYLMDHLYKRLREALFVDKARGGKTGNVTPDVIKAAWSFAVLGHSAEEILRQALYLTNTSPGKLTKADFLLANDLNNFAQNERRELQLIPLENESQEKAERAAWRRSSQLASSTRDLVKQSGFDRAIVDFVGGEVFLRRSVCADCGYLVHYAIQFDEKGQLVPFVGEIPENESVSGSRPADHGQNDLPSYKYTFSSPPMDSVTSDEALPGDSESTSLAVSDHEPSKDSFGEPVRRAAVRFMRKEDCVVGTNRPRGRTLMDLLQLSAAGWTVIGISEKEWTKLLTAEARQDYLQTKIFPRHDHENAA